MEDKISIIQNFKFNECFCKEELLEILKVVSPEFDTRHMKRIYTKKLDAEIKNKCDNDDKIEYLLKKIDEYNEWRERRDNMLRFIKATVFN